MSERSAAGQFATISRDLWAAVVKGLDSDDPAVRRAAFHRMLAAGPPSWDVDLEDGTDGTLDSRADERSNPGPGDAPDKAVSYSERVQRMGAAFMLMLDNTPVAYRTEGNPDVVERCARFMETERAEIERERRQGSPGTDATSR